jgi:cellulose synthase/poly-beta-1,6-N-acetylglucosamine synthase-like glycosyltransferase
MAAHNEEKVIEQKIHSVFNGNYPNELIEFYVGSDCSDDSTNEILTRLAEQYSQLKIFLFNERQGKINIQNQFLQLVENEIVISTDANNIFFEDTIYEFVSVMQDENIGLIDISMLHNNLNEKGMSYQENTYISTEAKLKYAEGMLFGAIGGPFGGCYAVRKKLWENVPDTFLNDDFYVNMIIYKKKYKAVTNYNAKIFEDVSNNPKNEFARKIRLATGDFQNLFRFFGMLMNPFTNVGFIMLSHRVLRWLGPFFLIFIFTASCILAIDIGFYFGLLIFEIACVCLCFVEILLKKMNINLFFIRYITHFFSSNLAMLLGFIKYCKGVETSIWSPTQRLQEVK